jgi:hypothetical protein
MDSRFGAYNSLLTHVYPDELEGVGSFSQRLTHANLENSTAEAEARGVPEKNNVLIGDRSGNGTAGDAAVWNADTHLDGSEVYGRGSHALLPQRLSESWFSSNDVLGSIDTGVSMSISSFFDGLDEDVGQDPILEQVRQNRHHAAKQHAQDVNTEQMEVKARAKSQIGMDNSTHVPAGNPTSSSPKRSGQRAFHASNSVSTPGTPISVAQRTDHFHSNTSTMLFLQRKQQQMSPQGHDQSSGGADAPLGSIFDGCRCIVDAMGDSVAFITSIVCSAVLPLLQALSLRYGITLQCSASIDSSIFCPADLETILNSTRRSCAFVSSKRGMTIIACMVMLITWINLSDNSYMQSVSISDEGVAAERGKLANFS